MSQQPRVLLVVQYVDSATVFMHVQWHGILLLCVEPPNVVSVIEGETVSACFVVDNPPVGGDFVVNVMANPGALPSKYWIGRRCFHYSCYTQLKRLI